MYVYVYIHMIKVYGGGTITISFLDLWHDDDDHDVVTLNS